MAHSEEYQKLEGRIFTKSFFILLAVVLVGFFFVGVRFVKGIGAVSNMSDGYPWGIWITYDVATGTAIACGGYAVAILVYIRNRMQYHPLIRSAILTSMFGYGLAGFSVMVDLGRPWNIIQAIFNYGTASVLFEVAWCVMLYTSVLLLEFTVPLFEWLGWTRIQAALKKTLIALTVLSVIFSTMHQSALGSLFLLMPTKLHPLWYTPYIFIFFFISAIVAGICMVVVESSLSHRIFASQVKDHPVDVDKLTIGLGRAGALVMFAYFFLKLQGVIDGHAWGYLATGYGAWFLVEILGFVLLPSLLFAYGSRNGKVRIVRVAGVIGVLGIVLNRANVSMIALNWNQPIRYVPSWMEIWVSVTLVTLGVLAFRWVVNRMPILREDPRFVEGH